MPEHQHIKQSRKSDTFPQRQIVPSRHTHVSNPEAIIQRARVDPNSLTTADVLQLQRTIGNRAVGRLLSGIGNPLAVQQAPIQRQKSEEEETCPSCLQRQRISDEEELGPLQGKFESKSEQAKCPSCSSAIVQRQELEEEEPLQMKRENNTGLPDNLKAGVENLSGIDMNEVRVHYNSSKPAEVGALAYTQGTDIHVAPGQERHLPHEAWHVVQQAEGRVSPTFQMKGVAINDDTNLEEEANRMSKEESHSNHIKANFYKNDKNDTLYLPSSASGIQRKVGFELEMEVLTDVEGKDPGYNTVLSNGSYFDLKVDHN